MNNKHKYKNPTGHNAANRMRLRRMHFFRWIALALLGPKKADSFGIGLWRKYVTYPRRYQCYAAHGKCFCSNFMFHVSVRFRFDSPCNRFFCKRCNEGKRSLATRLATIAQRNWCVYFVVILLSQTLDRKLTHSREALAHQYFNAISFANLEWFCLPFLLPFLFRRLY